MNFFGLFTIIFFHFPIHQTAMKNTFPSLSNTSKSVPLNLGLTLAIPTPLSNDPGGLLEFQEPSSNPTKIKTHLISSSDKLHKKSLIKTQFSTHILIFC